MQTNRQTVFTRPELVRLPAPEAPPVSLTDRLAVQRTELAVERTFLANLRISLAMIAGGAAASHMLGSVTAYVISGLAVLVAIGILVHAGLQRRRRQDELAGILAR